MKKFGVLLRIFLIVMATSLSASISTPFGSGIEAVIFDCDGVLVDTEYSKFLAWKEALSTKNILFTIEEYRPLVGNSSKNILQMIRQQKKIPIPDDVIDLKNVNYQLLQKQGVVPIPEVVAFARKLAEEKKRLGIKLGVASSAPKEEILFNLQQIGLENAFDLVISGSDDLEDYTDDEGKNKPKPYIYIEAAKRLQIDPLRCLVFEDTAAGIESAVGAKMIAIAVPNQFTIQQDFSKATKVLGSYTELLTKDFF
jgi:HAD superfamily hydrolase (TIGR01509 family)